MNSSVSRMPGRGTIRNGGFDLRHALDTLENAPATALSRAMPPTIPIPREPGFDSTVALLRDGYAFIPNRCRRHASPIFCTRILLQETICMSGEQAARLFYDDTRFQREGAAPKRLQKTLFGEGGVQGLDGDVHRHRKAMLMSLMGPQAVDRLVEITRRHWHSSVSRWEKKGTVVLFEEVRELLTRAVCEWAGVPLAEEEVETRANDFGAMIEGGAQIALGYLRGRVARKRAEAWIRSLVDDVRAGELKAEEGSALFEVAWHRSLDGELLDVRVAAVELLNVLRPTVAVARFITFAALALHEHPECREQLADDDYLERFVEEVRRFYPFFPFVAARTCEAFGWNGYRFPKNVRVLLDLYGTNHDAARWEAPERFDPERFRRTPPGDFDFIPQGGGQAAQTHRCPGESIAIALMKVALRELTAGMRYDVPPQDLSIGFSNIPTLPNSGFVISCLQR